MDIEILDAKRYKIHAFTDVFYITVSYTNDGYPCEILINFPPECDIPNQHQLVLNALLRSWNMLLENGISMTTIIAGTIPYNTCNDKFLNDLTQILSYGIGGEII